jgi:hypothetical protein
MTAQATSDSRKTWVVVVFGLVGLLVGAAVGYFGYYLGLDVPLVHLANDAKQSPFEQVFNGMARLQGLEVVAANCSGLSDPSTVSENEKHLINLLEVSATKANLKPQLDVARAIAAYRAAQIAQAHGDTQAFATAVGQEKSFLQAAGWKDTSPDHLASIVHEMDGCTTARTVSKGEKQ